MNLKVDISTVCRDFIILGGYWSYLLINITSTPGSCDSTDIYIYNSRHLLLCGYWRSTRKYRKTQSISTYFLCISTEFPKM